MINVFYSEKTIGRLKMIHLMGRIVFVYLCESTHSDLLDEKVFFVYVLNGLSLGEHLSEKIAMRLT